MNKFLLTFFLFMFGCTIKKHTIDINIIPYYTIQHGDHIDTLDQKTYLTNYDTSWYCIKEITTIKK